MHLHEVGFEPKPRLAGAGTAYNQDVFVPCVFGIRRSAVEGQRFGLRQDDVVFRLGVDIRLYIFFITPSGRTVFNV